MDVQPAPHRLPCAIEAPEAFVPRARYALRMLLTPLGFDPLWTDRADLAGPALYYGPDVRLPPGVLHLPLHEATLAYFAGRTSYPPDRAQWRYWEGEQWPVLFGGEDQADEDLIASAFFWLAGWQEHTVAARDRHGRFPHAASLQARWQTSGQPAVEAYRAWLGERLTALGVRVRRRRWRARTWALCPTHDIDYLRKGRLGMLRREFGLGAPGETPEAPPDVRRRRVTRAIGQAMRPGDVYRAALERMPEETLRRGGRGTYFFKTGAHGPHDVRSATGLRYLSRRIAALEEAGFEIGLHPSYHAHTHAGYLHDERARLEALTARPVVSVRQHYLRYEAPTTPRLHEAADFRIDATLGFAEHEGFRHGTCLPFQLFDIGRNAPLDVWEMPLALMDAALFNCRGLSLDEAQRVTGDLLRVCKRFGGVGVMLWHNVLWDEQDHAGWGRHFLQTLDAARAGGALITSLRDALDQWHGRPNEPMSTLP